MTYWSAHTHSRYSKDDALTPPARLVERAVELGYPALGLTDHGNMAGAAQLYLAGKKHDLPVLPGVEMYMTGLHEDLERRSMHLTMLAYTGQGYRNLVALHNQAHRQVYFKPRLDFADLAAAAEAGRTAGIALLTGCRSGPVVRALVERGPEPAQQLVEALAGWFPRVYVELMNHHFKADGMSDDEICLYLASIADKTGVPTILTGDAHYALPEEKDAHDALKRLVSWSDDPADGQFSGEGYWLRSHAELDPWQAGMEGLADLAAAAKVTIPELDTFTLKIPDVTLKGTQYETFEAKVLGALEEFFDQLPEKHHETYAQRVSDELDVIKATGMAPYLLLVLLLCEFMWREEIWFHTRGSAAGSLCLYLTKVTQVDPIADDIRMDRFLSGDRTSVPDVDLDIEHEKRDLVVKMAEDLGYELVQVGTQPVYGLDAETSEEGDEKGSLRVKYFGTQRKLGKDKIEWADVPLADKQMLTDLAERELIAGVGAHPGGYVIAADAPTISCLPLVQITSSKTFVTAFDKGEVEQMGFPKIDLLGSKALTAIKHACTLIAPEDPRAWYDAIPRNDKDAIGRCGAGETTGLFQLGGWTQKRGLEDLKPKKTADIIAAQALFRPAPMNSGFTKTYLKRRRKEEEVPQLHADIMEETKTTFGLAIYQEQVVGMLRRMGVPPVQLTRILKAVKSSGKAGEAKAKQIVAEEIGPLKGMAQERGWDARDWDYLHGCLLDYGAGYSFGKAHSVTYGLVAYRTAYLASHEPLAYWTGMLNAYLGAKNSKGEALEPTYIRAARKDGVQILPPHVNHSGAGYTPDPERFAIRRGLVSIKGVGHTAAQELIDKRPFESLVDLGLKVSGKVTGAKNLVTGATPQEAGGNVAALHEARALDGLPAGTPIEKGPVSRKRKCDRCKVTFTTPAELTAHDVEEHAEERLPV